MWTMPDSLRVRGWRARILLALACFCLCVAAPAGATLTYFSASIDGPQEGNAQPGTGTGTFTMDTVANTLSFNITFSGLGSAEIAAHIHGFAGPGVPAGILFPLPGGSPKVGVWPFLAAQQANITAGLTYVNIHSVNFPGGEIRGQILATGGSCGDGVVDAGFGETCDDTNTTPGDGCSATCQVEPCFTCSGGPSVCTPIVTCTNGDGCCPGGCNIGNDNDCTPPIPAVTPPGTIALAVLLSFAMMWALRRRFRTT
jgi:cysteine-rich repeat protein